MDDLISRQAAIDALRCCMDVFVTNQPTLIYREEVLTALSHFMEGADDS